MSEMFRSRLQGLIDQRGITMKQLSLDAGLSATAIRDALKRRASPQLSTIQAAARALGVPVGYLVGEIDQLEEGAEGEPATPAKLPALALTAPGFLELGSEEFASVGRFDAALSAGHGSLLEAEPDPLGYQLFEAQWLRSVTQAAPDHLAVVRVDGDSMEQTLSNGDWVLVDLTQRSFNREGVYALRIGDAGWIKRLSLNLRDRLVRVISDNALYPMQELTEEELDIIGRVVCIVARRV
ncbi:MAG: S24 family peptidase [Pseudomonadota bacterium]